MEVTVNIDIAAIKADIEKKLREDLQRYFGIDGTHFGMEFKSNVHRKVSEKIANDFYERNASKIIAELDYKTILNSAQLLVGRHIRDSFKD